MKSSAKFFLAVAAACAAVAGGGGHAYAQTRTSEQLRATRQVGESWNGYMAAVGPVNEDIRRDVNAINVIRRKHYAELARERGVTMEEVGATMACDIFATSILPGQYYQLRDGIWRQRRGSEPVLRPAYCG